MTKSLTKSRKPDALRNLAPTLERELGALVMREVDELQAYAGNPRVHPEKQIVQLMASIREFGFSLPVLVDTDNVLITGHARVEAARRLGMTRIPVLVADTWSVDRRGKGTPVAG